jgi:hypothetical protein
MALDFCKQLKQPWGEVLSAGVADGPLGLDGDFMHGENMLLKAYQLCLDRPGVL